MHSDELAFKFLLCKGEKEKEKEKEGAGAGAGDNIGGKNNTESLGMQASDISYSPRSVKPINSATDATDC
jgi:hypothetical protein